MGANWGSAFRLSIFGESHGEAIGMVIDGLPAGIEINLDDIALDMARRAPGNDPSTTPRKEGDEVQILSGLFNKKTTGAPICGVIYNNNTRSKDYANIKDILRPGHADYSAFVKHRGFNDYRGSGHFSGRLTAPFVFAGSIARAYLSQLGVEVGAHIESIAGVCDERIDPVNLAKNTLIDLRKSKFPLINRDKEIEMREKIESAKADGDSVGGTIECMASGVPAGWGDPFFDSLESRISHLAFSIPAVKAIEFGAGFLMSDLRGSETNDCFYLDEESVKTRTNNNGGINGGISNSMPIVFRVGIKPTPSISKAQETINILDGKSEMFSTHGRHDPCIILRAVPVVEAALLIALCESALMEGK